MLTRTKRPSRPLSALAGVLALCALAAAPPAVPGKEAGRAAYVVVLKEGAGDPGAAAARLSRRYRAGAADGPAAFAVYRHALRGYAARLTPDEAARLRTDPAVRAVSAPRSYRAAPPAHSRPAACRMAAGPGQCLPEWADRIDAERSSARSGDGRGAVTGVNVAVMDSGIDATHPDLDVRGGADCLSGSPVVPGNSLVVGDPHGTEAAGIVAAKDDAGGIVGVAPGAPLWA
ncbi:S8 family serine peptidase [Streptomyces sp. NPDC059708]|uniref:S8 family serine peptidase n=1 Tax=Streptomyces sp. NPDC059708 TaxID=3346916 RepID=UPI00369449C3